MKRYLIEILFLALIFSFILIMSAHAKEPLYLKHTIRSGDYVTGKAAILEMNGVTNSNTATESDFDCDGDFDIVIPCEDGSMVVWENLAKNDLTSEKLSQMWFEGKISWEEKSRISKALGLGI